jgi:hypothetical protein
MFSTLLGNAVLLALYFYVAVPAPAHAYFDLGTGAYMLQLIFGVGAAFFLSFRQQVARKLGLGKPKPTADAAQTEVKSTDEPTDSTTLA